MTTTKGNYQRHFDGTAADLANRFPGVAIVPSPHYRAGSLRGPTHRERCLRAVKRCAVRPCAVHVYTEIVDYWMVLTEPPTTE